MTDETSNVSKIADSIRANYNLAVTSVTPLSLGADSGTEVYKLVTDQGKMYFVKCRKRAFSEASVLFPHFLKQQEIDHVIAPLAISEGKLWITLEEKTLSLYPFIEGTSGFSDNLSEAQWQDFGTTLRKIHQLDIQQVPITTIKKETFLPIWRDKLRKLLESIETATFTDKGLRELIALIKTNYHRIKKVLSLSQQLSLALKDKPLTMCLCHGDIHAGNILLSSDDFYIVDWDTVILAPKERDLMFIGGGVGGKWNKPEEVTQFYKGYGAVTIDQPLLTYYRCERIVEDIAASSEAILSGKLSQTEIREMLENLTQIFKPNDVVEIALRTKAI